MSRKDDLYTSYNESHFELSRLFLNLTDQTYFLKSMNSIQFCVELSNIEKR